MIEAHNSSNLSYTMKENHLMDLTFEEFSSLYLGVAKNNRDRDERSIMGHESIADSIDWRQRGAVSPVKD